MLVVVERVVDSFIFPRALWGDGETTNLEVP